MSDESGSLQSQFFADAQDLLTDAEEVVLSLENEGFDDEKINGLFRLFHTLKGNANMVGLEGIGRLCHTLESRLDLVRKGNELLGEDLLQISLEIIDLLSGCAATEEEDAVLEQLPFFEQRLNEEPGKPGKPEEPGEPQLQESSSGEPRASCNSEEEDDQADGAAAGSSPQELASAPARAPADAGASPGGPSNSASTISSAGPATGAAPGTLSYKELFPLLLPLARVKKIAEDLSAASSEDEGFDLLMELGMEVIDLRSIGENECFGFLGERILFLEKFVTALVRLQAPYDPITFELFYILLDTILWDVKHDVNHAPWIHRVVIDEPMQLRDLVSVEVGEESPEKESPRRGAEGAEKEEPLLVELRIGEATLYQIGDLFNQCRRLREGRKGPVLFLHPRPGSLEKASGLLGESLEGDYPTIYAEILPALLEAAVYQKERRS